MRKECSTRIYSVPWYKSPFQPLFQAVSQSIFPPPSGTRGCGDEVEEFEEDARDAGESAEIDLTDHVRARPLQSSRAS